MSAEMIKSLNILTGKIHDRLTIILESLGRGVAKDYAEYHNMVGQVRGLKEAMVFITELHKHIDEDSDDILT